MSTDDITSNQRTEFPASKFEMALTVTERWICERVNLKHDNLDDVKSLSLPGSYHEKIVHLGNSLKGFTRLKHLDLSRNGISILDGLEHLKLLETLNLYYNNITSLKELYKLRYNANLKEIDIRLNPVTKNEPDYRLFLIHMIPTLKILDDRSIRDSERKAALSHFNTDQASQFEESPPKMKQKVDSERMQRSSRSDIVRKFSSRHTVLDDDDVALIDLVSKADLGRENVEKGSYYAETYDKNELNRIALPHAEKYSTRQELESTPSNKGKQSYHQEELPEEAPLQNRVEMYYNRQPFVSNGYFTPNPTSELVGSSGHFEKVLHRHQLKDERSGIAKETLPLSGKSVSRTYEFHTPSHNERHGSEGEEVNAVSYYRKKNSTAEEDDEIVMGQRSFVSPADFKTRVFNGDPKPPHSQKMKAVPQELDFDQNHDLLLNLLLLVDKYWNGSGSLQTNQKFQKIAGELISRDLKKSRNHSDSNALELESRDKELADLRTQLKRVQVENERIKKRLQNEEEIQRTIEMTDQDLKRLQTRIEEVQAENKTLKSKCAENDIERKSTEKLRNDSDELRRNIEVLHRENRTLSQQCEQQSTTLSQLQELTSMLQESHRSLVVTNDHLLQELDDTRQRHQQEVQQLHWSYEQLKKTAEWLPRSIK